MSSPSLTTLALRNLRRHLRRSVITGSSIAVGLALFIFSVNFAEGTYEDMIETGVGMMAGHVVVQERGYQQDPSADSVVPHATQVARRLSRLAPTARVTQRIFLPGLLSSPQGSGGVTVSAVEPRVEQQVSRLDDKIIAGRYLGEDARDVVIGRVLAETLDVGLGDKVVLMVQSRGELQSQLFRVRGIFAAGSDELDGFYAQVTLPAAQQLLGRDDVASQVALHLEDARHTKRYARAANEALARSGLEVLPWQKALPELASYVQVDRAGNYVFLLVIAAIVTIGIMNTMLMSVLERTRELGVMLALGLTPSGVARLVLLEAAILGGLSSLAGLALGLALTWPLSIWGFDLAQLYGGQVSVGGVALESRLYADVGLARSFLFSSLAVVIALLAALWPALRAAYLEPVEAMRGL